MTTNEAPETTEEQRKGKTKIHAPTRIDSNPALTQAISYTQVKLDSILDELLLLIDDGKRVRVTRDLWDNGHGRQLRYLFKVAEKMLCAHPRFAPKRKLPKADPMQVVNLDGKPVE